MSDIDKRIAAQRKAIAAARAKERAANERLRKAKEDIKKAKKRKGRKLKPLDTHKRDPQLKTPSKRRGLGYA